MVRARHNNTLHTEPRAARHFLLASLSPRPGERCRYHAYYMPRFSLKTMLLLFAVTALFLVPLSFLVRHTATWGPAEQTEDMLAELYRDAIQQASDEFTIETINDLLETPKFKFLNQHRTYEIELRDGELAWFSPNSKYSIGISQNGVKHWIINGKRTGD